ncbi:MAG: hypothetical protein ACMXYA_00760 [Candidatus Woesearchaeota archaeon]
MRLKNILKYILVIVSCILLFSSISLALTETDILILYGHHYSELYLGPIQIVDNNVGILTSNPEFLLDINESVRFRAICLNDACVGDLD